MILVGFFMGCNDGLTPPSSTNVLTLGGNYLVMRPPSCLLPSPQYPPFGPLSPIPVQWQGRRCTCTPAQIKSPRSNFKSVRAGLFLWGTRLICSHKGPLFFRLSWLPAQTDLLLNYYWTSICHVGPAVKRVVARRQWSCEM